MLLRDPYRRRPFTYSERLRVYTRSVLHLGFEIERIESQLETLHDDDMADRLA